METVLIISIIVVIIAFVFLVRVFGAWLLRIDEVIELQREQTKLLRELNDKFKKQ